MQFCTSRAISFISSDCENTQKSFFSKFFILLLKPAILMLTNVSAQEYIFVCVKILNFSFHFLDERGAWVDQLCSVKSVGVLQGKFPHHFPETRTVAREGRARIKNAGNVPFEALAQILTFPR
jgi:hypothetical protein